MRAIWPGVFLQPNFREGLVNQWGKNGAQLARAAIVALIRRQIREPLRTILLRVAVNFADGRPFFGKPNEVRPKSWTGGSTN